MTWRSHRYRVQTIRCTRSVLFSVMPSIASWAFDCRMENTKNSGSPATAFRLLNIPSAYLVGTFLISFIHSVFGGRSSLPAALHSDVVPHFGFLSKQTVKLFNAHLKRKPLFSSFIHRISQIIFLASPQRAHPAPPHQPMIIRKFSFV